jgi:general secretion pathway protein A
VVLYPALTASELLGSILDDLHVEAEGDSLKSRVDALHRFLLEARAAGRNVVLLIDESQDLSAEVLEQVRLISNLETDTEKLIQIVLMGQSELRDVLARHELRQLAQRVTARYHLAPLDLAETNAYVRHRLTVAGGEGKVGFTADALRDVHRLTGGVPRLINLVCDRVLLAGYVRNVRSISAEMVRQAAAEVTDERPGRSFEWHHGLIATALTVGLAVVAFGLAPRLARAPGGDSTAPDRAEAAPAVTVRAPPRSERLETLLRTLPRDDSFRAAVRSVESAWGGSGLEGTTLRTHLSQLRRLGLPAVLEMFHPSRRDTCFLALLGLEDEAATVAIGDDGALEVPVSQVDALWTREAILPWPEAREIPSDPAGRGAWIRDTLRDLGYDAGDRAATVSQFQQDAGLVTDGVAGPRTCLALFALSRTEGPRLTGTGGTR